MTVPAKRKYRGALFPRKLAESAERMAAPLLQQQGLSAKLITDWPLIVGKSCAAHTLPRKIVFAAGKKSGGVLHIKTTGTYALQLQHLEPRILQQIATYFGYRAVERLVIHQGLVPPKAAAGDRHTAPSPAPSQEVMNIVSQVTDEALKASLTRFATMFRIKSEDR